MSGIHPREDIQRGEVISFGKILAQPEPGLSSIVGSPSPRGHSGDEVISLVRIFSTWMRTSTRTQPPPQIRYYP